MTTQRGLTMVRASAGSGKTYRLTNDVCDAVRAETRVDGLVAVTFTTRAAAELEARIRQSLVRAGAFERVHRLPLAYVGTVHAVCLRLVQELALDAGLSPRVDVLPDDGGQLLREALEWALPPAFLTRMDALAGALAIEQEWTSGRVNWLWPVAEIMELARQNRIPADGLGAMGERSAAELCALLPAPVTDGRVLDERLRVELDAASAWLGHHDDGTKGTRAACHALHDILRGAEGLARPAWPAWVKLVGLSPTKASRDRFQPLQAAAAQYERHPDLHADLRAITVGVFEAARLGLQAFDRWKRERGLVDYVDMIDQAVTLLDRPAVGALLRERLDMVVVDEFQDTSPLQLALFTRLHGLVGRSVWVGDRKQCIFEFAGADPVLLDAVAAWTAREGGEAATLSRNHRSRPELVTACSTLFSAAFARFGYEPDEVEVAPHRPSPPDAPAPVGLWWLDAGSHEEEAAAIAEGVRRLLEAPAATRVVDRATGQARPLRPGDVAILVDTNRRADALATALQERGVTAAHARAGLLATPEGTVVDAALRWLLDDRDTLSEAVLEALHGFGGGSPDEWLAARLRRVEAAEACTDVPPDWSARLRLLRERLEVLAPAEAVDLVLEALDALRLASAWPEPSQRRGNLDAIRAMARAYEDRCAHRREAATVAGLLRYFDDARKPVITRDSDRARDDQHLATGDHAVTVSTYHKAKGLEWPVVVLGSLDRRERRTAFGVLPETDGAPFDPAEPLAGRRIRYWPRPFGSTKTLLVDAAARAPEGRAVAAREDHERVRLLYVGMTRARDHLVLAVRLAKAPKAAWLDDLADAGGPLLDLAAAVGEGAMRLPLRDRSGKPCSIDTRAWRLGVGATPPARLARSERHHWFARPEADTALASRPRYGIAPSRAAEDWPDLPEARVSEVVRLGEPLSVSSEAELDWAAVGHAAHDFLAADDPMLDSAARTVRADRLLAAHGLAGRIRADALLAGSDRLRTWVCARWPDARWRHELPVEARIETPSGTRLVSGRIDLLLETPAGLVIIDHKTFPAPHESAWRKAAREHGVQLMAYVEALRRADGRPIVGTWLHFVLGGGLVGMAARDPLPL
jgi:ATP-dependent exoDNAse (exonuclease V) beta subunit